MTGTDDKLLVNTDVMSFFFVLFFYSDSLLLSLELVNSVLCGVSAYLPHFTGPPVEGW